MTLTTVTKHHNDFTGTNLNVRHSLSARAAVEQLHSDK